MQDNTNNPFNNPSPTPDSPTPMPETPLTSAPAPTSPTPPTPPTSIQDPTSPKKSSKKIIIIIIAIILVLGIASLVIFLIARPSTNTNQSDNPSDDNHADSSQSAQDVAQQSWQEVSKLPKYTYAPLEITNPDQLAFQAGRYNTTFPNGQVLAVDYGKLIGYAGFSYQRLKPAFYDSDVSRDISSAKDQKSLQDAAALAQKYFTKPDYVKEFYYYYSHEYDCYLVVRFTNGVDVKIQYAKNQPKTEAQSAEILGRFLSAYTPADTSLTNLNDYTLSLVKSLNLNVSTITFKNLTDIDLALSTIRDKSTDTYHFGVDLSDSLLYYNNVLFHPGTSGDDSFLETLSKNYYAKDFSVNNQKYRIYRSKKPDTYQYSGECPGEDPLSGILYSTVLAVIDGNNQYFLYTNDADDLKLMTGKFNKEQREAYTKKICTEEGIEAHSDATVQKIINLAEALTVTK